MLIADSFYMQPLAKLKTMVKNQSILTQRNNGERRNDQQEGLLPLLPPLAPPFLLLPPQICRRGSIEITAVGELEPRPPHC